VAAIPDGLENSVRETERQNVLDRFFAQVVIDAVDLALRSDFQKLLIQSLGGFQIMAERLFDNHAPPMAVLFSHQADLRDPLYDVAEEVGRSGEIEEIVAVGVMLLVNLGQRFLKLVVSSGIVEISTDVIDALNKPFPQIFINGASGELFEVFGE